ncbi:MAG: PHP domain-containing protein [Clostridia bacterium]|nr:PHP domain-containing protein [Clostridia bacterium]MBR1703973.1 PHP domain-containing protein [Clostridia bacterium]
MRKVFVDLHNHSCLSPCGEDDMMPALVAGLHKLAGVDVAALTDHNTTRNCPAFFEAAGAYGLSPLAGMELTTAEDIHVICLFLTPEEAAAFEEEVYKRRVLIPNRVDIFGNQFIVDANDCVIGEEPYYLVNATTLTLEEAYDLATRMGGVCYPAHIDRPANGLIAVLGDFPEHPKYRFAEFNDPANIPAYREKYSRLRDMKVIYGSDAHRPDAVPTDAVFSIEVEEDGTPAEAVFRYLKGG